MCTDLHDQVKGKKQTHIEIKLNMFVRGLNLQFDSDKSMQH